MRKEREKRNEEFLKHFNKFVPECNLGNHCLLLVVDKGKPIRYLCIKCLREYDLHDVEFEVN